MPISYNPRNRFMPDRSMEPPDVYEKCPECPCCGSTAETFMLDGVGNIIGCQDCIHTVDALDYLEDLEDAAREWAEELRREDW